MPPTLAQVGLHVIEYYGSSNICQLAVSLKDDNAISFAEMSPVRDIALLRRFMLFVPSIGIAVHHLEKQNVNQRIYIKVD